MVHLIEFAEQQDDLELKVSAEDAKGLPAFFDRKPIAKLRKGDNLVRCKGEPGRRERDFLRLASGQSPRRLT